ncbi:MAG: asparaginase [Nakamurella sp.]
MASPAGALPLVVYLALGGTIAAVADAAGGGATPTLTSDELLATVPGLIEVARLTTRDTAAVGSSRLTIADVLRLRDAALVAVDDGACGVVVSQGTDSLEETAFALDLLWDRPEPVVFTAAMRNPSLPGADGPANLLAAVRCAVAGQARGLGVLVTLNDEVHAARFVRKTHTSNVATFASPPVGPLGWIVEDRVRIPLRPGRFPALRVPASAPTPPVALLTSVLDDDGRMLSALPDLGYRGLVVAAMGGGHLPPSWLPGLRDLVGRMPVVLASRTGSGEGLQHTYGSAGSEIELLAAGLLPAGALHPFKARVLLMLALAADFDPPSMRALFDSRGSMSAADA